MTCGRIPAARIPLQIEKVCYIIKYNLDCIVVAPPEAPLIGSIAEAE
jgi:hypothetical protein